MSKTPRLFIVDVFAESAYKGNPLAVVLDADSLSDETMQLIATEMNYSETTFVLTNTSEADRYHTRIFTPSQEIAFAGHPILGTAWVIRHYVSQSQPESLSIIIGVGQIPVRFTVSPDNKEVVWFQAPPVSFDRTCDHGKIADALGLSPADIDTQYPVQQIAATTSAMIVPLRSLDALQRSRLDLDAYAPLADDGFPPLVYLFCRQTHSSQNDLCARFFFDAYGVREDPATGNGAAFLGYYLLAHQFFPESDFTVRIEQGYEIRRPSLVMLRATNTHGTHEVNVGGHVVPILQGELV